MAEGGGHRTALGPVGSLTTLGTVSSWLVVLLAAWGSGMSIVAVRTRSNPVLASAARAVVAQAGLALVSLLALGTALGRGDFNVALVADATGRVAPLGYRVAALTATGAGIALLLACASSATSAFLLPRYPAGQQARLTAATSVVVLLLALFVIAWARPFARLPYTPLDGAAPDWRFRHPGAVVEAGLTIAGWSALLWATLARWSRGPAGGDRAAALASVLLSVALGMSVWRWYATLAPAPGGFFTVRETMLAASWIAACGWVVVRRGRARILMASATVLSVLWLSTVEWGSSREASLAPGDTVSAPSWGRDVVLTHSGVSRVEIPSGVAAAATLELDAGDEGPSRLVVTERRNYFDVVGRPVGVPLVRPAVAFGLMTDVRVELVGVAARGDRADYRARVVPAIWLLGLTLALAVAGGGNRWLS